MLFNKKCQLFWNVYQRRTKKKIFNNHHHHWQVFVFDLLLFRHQGHLVKVVQAGKEMLPVWRGEHVIWNPSTWRHSCASTNVWQECRREVLLCGRVKSMCVHVHNCTKCISVSIVCICQLSVCLHLHLACQSANQCMCRKSPTLLCVGCRHLPVNSSCISLCIFMFVCLPSCHSEVFVKREKPSFSAEGLPTERTEKPIYLSGNLWLPAEW